MPNTKSLVLRPKLKILVWSASGTGKTHLAGTFRADGPCYFFDFDKRMETLAGLDIDYDSYRDTDPFRPVAYDGALKKLEELHRNCPYRTIVLDSLTTFAIAAMNKVMPLAKSFMPKMTRMGDGKTEVPVMQDFMGQMKFIEQFMLKLVALPCHVIVTAHETTDKDEITQQIFKNIAVTGKLSNQLPGLFNEVWRMETKPQVINGVSTPTYHLRTRPDNLHTARTTYREALDVLEKPDFAHLYKKICDHLEKKFPEAYKESLLKEVENA